MTGAHRGMIVSSMFDDGEKIVFAELVVAANQSFFFAVDKKWRVGGDETFGRHDVTITQHIPSELLW